MTAQMSRRDKVRTAIAVIINALIVIFTAYGMSRFFTVGGDGNMAVMNTRCFQFFTVDSNLLAALAALLLLIGQISFLRGGKPPHPALLVLKHVGATAVGVTFFTVFCFLGTLYGYRSMIAGVNLYMHLLTPLLAMLGFCLLEKQPRLRFRGVFLGLLPTILYGIVYVILVVFQKRCLMVIATCLISRGLWALRRASAGKREKTPETV